jgi:hypothetical protein
VSPLLAVLLARFAVLRFALALARGRKKFWTGLVNMAETFREATLLIPACPG